MLYVYCYKQEHNPKDLEVSPKVCKECGTTIHEDKSLHLRKSLRLFSDGHLGMIILSLMN